MSSPIAIRCQDIAKVFHMHRSAWRRLRAAFSSGTLEGDHRLQALDGISFEVSRGESLGIVGPNGSGKSTLLKILARILQPTSGTLHVKGRVASIIELGGGFHAEFTGRQNFFMSGAILGFTHAQLEAMYERAVAFSGLGAFMEMPIKTYSSGMWARLAFTIAIHMEPEILLVDEALAVGDAVFSHRCLGRIHALRERGVTLVLVSHDVNAIKQMCNQALLLDQGRVVSQGATDDVLTRYQTMVAEQLTEEGIDGAQFHKIGAVDLRKGGTDVRYGTFEAVIEGFTVCTVDGQPTLRFNTGERMVIEMVVRSHVNVEMPVFGIMLRNRFGIEVFGTNTHLMAQRVVPIKAGEIKTVRYETDLVLNPGTYDVSLAVHTVDGRFLDYQVEATHIEILGPSPTVGVANLPIVIETRPGGDPSSVKHASPAPTHPGGQPAT